MLNKSLFRLASLLLTIGLLLGLALTGCSSSDRNVTPSPDPSPDPSPEPTTATTIFYNIKVAQTKVAQTNDDADVYLAVQAYDNEDFSVAKKIEASVVGSNKLADMPDNEEKEGYKVAEIEFAQGAKVLECFFYYGSEEGNKVFEFAQVFSVENAEPGDEIFSTDENVDTYTASIVTYADKELKTPASEFTVGDTFYVQACAVDSEGEAIPMGTADGVVLTSSDSEKVVIGEYDTEVKAFACEAKDTTTDAVTIVASRGDYLCTSAEVTVVPGFEKHLYYRIDSEATSLDADGHLLFNGAIVESIEDMRKYEIGTHGVQHFSTAAGSQTTRDFIALIHTGDDASGYPLFTDDKNYVPQGEYEVTVQTLQGGSTYTATYKDGVMTVTFNCEDETNKCLGEFTTELDEGWESETCSWDNVPGV